MRSVSPASVEYLADVQALRAGPAQAIGALDPRQLECFIAVAEELNLRRAAMRLYMAQPPLTRRIHRLENAIGAQLFHRTAAGLKLTEAGSELLARAYRMVEFARSTLETVDLARAGELGPLIVGYNDPVIVAGVPQLLRRFVAHHPHVDLRFRLVPKHAQVHYLRDHSLHVAFGREFVDEPGIASSAVLAEKLYVAFRPDGYTLEAATVSTSDLRDLPLVVYPDQRGGFVDELFRRFRESGFAPPLVSDAEDMVAALAYVAVGAAIAVVPESATAVRAPGVAFTPLRDMAPVEVICAYPVDGHSPTLNLFIEFVQSEISPSIRAEHELWPVEQSA